MATIKSLSILIMHLAVYLSVNMVMGTFVSLPIDEKLLQTGKEATNFFKDPIYMQAVDHWYKIAALVFGFALMLTWIKPRVPRSILIVLGVLLWMLSAVDLHFSHSGIDWTVTGLLPRYYVFTLAVAIVTQFLAYEAVEKLPKP